MRRKRFALRKSGLWIFCQDSTHNGLFIKTYARHGTSLLNNPLYWSCTVWLSFSRYQVCVKRRTGMLKDQVHFKSINMTKTKTIKIIKKISETIYIIAFNTKSRERWWLANIIRSVQFFIIISHNWRLSKYVQWVSN